MPHQAKPNPTEIASSEGKDPNGYRKSGNLLRENGARRVTGGAPSARLLVNPNRGRRPDHWTRKAIDTKYAIGT